MGRYLDLARSVLPVSASAPGQALTPLLVADAHDAPICPTAPSEKQQPEPQAVAEAIAQVVTALRDRGTDVQEVVLMTPTPELELTRPLSEILPPPSWLTLAQRRLWRERTAFYRSTGLSQGHAEQEAMAELVMTGKLYDSSKAMPWP